MIRLENVKFKNILKIDKLNIEHKSFVALIGHSGSGKTTLLKLIARLILVDQGKIKYKDQDILSYQIRDYRREVLYLTQKPYLFQGTVKDNLLVGAGYHNLEFKEEKLKAILNFVKLNKALDQNVEHFSLGEAQRLALARLLLLKPKVLLLDEPTAQFDHQLEYDMMDLLKKLNTEDDVTIIMATHHLEIAKKYATHIIDVSKKESETL